MANDFFSGERFLDTEKFVTKLLQQDWFKKSNTPITNKSKADIKKWVRKLAREEKFLSRKPAGDVYIDVFSFAQWFTTEYQTGTKKKILKGIDAPVTEEEKAQWAKMKDNPIIAQMLSSLENNKEEKTE